MSSVSSLSGSPSRPATAAGSGRLYDWTVVFLAGVLMALGVAMVCSASATVEGTDFDWRQWWKSPLKQCVYAVAGFFAMLVAAHVDYRSLAWSRRGAGWPAGLLLVLATVLLVAMLVPGVGQQALGARRALVVYPGPPRISFQPSEVAKVVLVIWLAVLLTRPTTPARARQPKRRWRFPLAGEKRSVAGPAADGPPLLRGDVRDLRSGFLPAVLSAGVLVGLTGIEDFGTAALMGVVMLIMLYLAGARWTHLGLTGLVAASAGAVLVLIKPHRVTRIVAFFSETPDPKGAGYQIDQALKAIGSGGWFGRGLGAGVQKYGYLPQDNNDFILAIICEELGVVGGLVVVGLFLLLLWRGWRIATHAPDHFGRLLALGLTLTICLQAAFNVGVVTDSLPTKGISLPFVSAGGSGVVFLGLAAGLLAAVGRTPRLKSYAERV